MNVLNFASQFSQALGCLEHASKRFGCTIFFDRRRLQERLLMLSKSLLIACTLLHINFLHGSEAHGQRTTLSERNQTIKTYPYSDPNPIPTLAINGKVAAYYPYFIFDGYADKAIGKVVALENEFIKVTVLPEAGGKVRGAIEKSTGKEFIYTNHVMKFRAIGIRGPWTSGGIEHNFGLDLGHAPWTAAEVDYVLIENADGSASCVVGGLDLASRTQWRVHIHGGFISICRTTKPTSKQEVCGTTPLRCTTPIYHGKLLPTKQRTICSFISPEPTT